MAVLLGRRPVVRRLSCWGGEPAWSLAGTWPRVWPRGGTCSGFSEFGTGDCPAESGWYEFGVWPGKPEAGLIAAGALTTLLRAGRGFLYYASSNAAPRV